MAEIENAEFNTLSHPTIFPPGFVGHEEGARISGIGITAWRRWLAEGKITCGQRFIMPRAGWCHIFSVAGIQEMMRNEDLSFPPPGMVDIHEAARALDRKSVV